MSGTAANRRRFTRVLAHNLFAEVMSGSLRLKWEVQNISEGGLFVRTEKLLPAGTTMLLTLRQFGQKASVLVEEMIVYALAKPGGMGVRFENVNPEAKGRIHQLVEGFNQAVKFSGAPTAPQKPISAENPMPGDPNPKRRAHRRVSVHKLRANVLSSDGQVLRGAEVKDISPGGAFIETDRALVVGTQVSVELNRPGTEARVTLAGQVIRVVTSREARMRNRWPGMSIRFAEMPEELEAELRALMALLAPSVHWGR